MELFWAKPPHRHCFTPLKAPCPAWRNAQKILLHLTAIIRFSVWKQTFFSQTIYSTEKYIQNRITAPTGFPPLPVRIANAAILSAKPWKNKKFLFETLLFNHTSKSCADFWNHPKIFGRPVSRNATNGRFYSISVISTPHWIRLSSPVYRNTSTIKAKADSCRICAIRAQKRQWKRSKLPEYGRFRPPLQIQSLKQHAPKA